MIALPNISSKLNLKFNCKKAKPLLLGLYFLLILTVLYHVFLAKKIIFGVMVGPVKVGGMTYSQAVSALENYEENLDTKLELVYESKSHIISAEEIDLVYDIEASVTRAFEVGRTGRSIIDNKDKVVGILKNLFIPAIYDYDDDLLSTKFLQIKGDINIESENSCLTLDEDDEVAIKDSVIGKKVADDALYTIVIASFDHMDFGQKVLPTKVINPKVQRSDVEKVFDQAKEIVTNTLTVTNVDKTWILEKEQLIDFLCFDVTVKSSAEDRNTQTELKLNEPRFEAFLDNLASEVNQLPRGQVTEVQDGKVIAFEIIQEGSELDKRQFTEDFKEAFFNKKETATITMKEVSGPASKEKYGIFALLGEGSSHYKGSAQSRINNLTLAAKRTNGVLVPPDGIYSMNNSVGDISTKTGYDTAYIIKGDRTILGAGGGVCQTSTTLFRAVLNSGLPVVMRYPHAYRVSYYEQDMPVGFDAAIYQPSWDFQFKNDTSNYVLVQSEANLEDYSLTFKIFGTPDGREVEISEPVITNQSPPPPALYQDDDTLAKGVVKQIDFPAWGADVRFTRKVTKGDEVLFEDTFTSRFQPWRAIYLVGTKE